MNIFLYLDENTWFHRLDPRTKIIGVLLLFGLPLAFNDPRYVGAVALGLVALGAAAKALPNFWRMRYLLLLLVLFSSVLWPFFAKGPTPLWSWGPLEVSRESLLFGIAMGLRLASFVAAGLIFLSTTTNEEFTQGLIRLRLPYPVAFAFSTALRLVPTFAGAGATIVQAQVSRGLDLESGNVFQRGRKFIPLAVPLFIYAVRHTNLLAMALESRGFSPLAQRTWYVQLRMRRDDYIALAVLATLFVAAVALRLAGYGAVLPRL
ncbi:MAG: energy-coupling factor transporter transmembrane protein EcfT [Caldilineales bacterium]|nr:energy-coupling factor transporter transmembrane protein EcfT [Caldilineales bacterium]MDW8318712.1 energy-coupling factor transporter transmembrane component T [Anaerolineae bacterium]